MRGGKSCCVTSRFDNYCYDMKLRLDGKIADLGADYCAVKPLCKQQWPAGTNDTSQHSICSSPCTLWGECPVQVQEVIRQERCLIQTNQHKPNKYKPKYITNKQYLLIVIHPQPPQYYQRMMNDQCTHGSIDFHLLLCFFNLSITIWSKMLFEDIPESGSRFCVQPCAGSLFLS